MARTSYLLLALAVVTLALAATTAAAADADYTENDFKKMKIKELRSWMDERGLNCPDCQEKVDFVKFCTKNAKAPLLNARKPVEVTGKFWEMWSNTAKEICTRQVTRLSVNDGEAICDAIAVAVDSYFQQHGRRTATKLKKKPDALARTSVGDTYFNAGRRLLGKLVKYCLKPENRATCSSSSNVNDIIDKNMVKGADLNMWITNVGIENTNPMYEAIKDKSISEDEL